jgi:hypothetical protein
VHLSITASRAILKDPDFLKSPYTGFGRAPQQGALTIRLAQAPRTVSTY